LNINSDAAALSAGNGIARCAVMERGDRLPGRSPRIEADRDVVTFTFRIDTYEGRVIELVIRCERGGEMFAALRSAKSTDAAS
jgi:hypothetical protein